MSIPRKPVARAEHSTLIGNPRDASPSPIKPDSSAAGHHETISLTGSVEQVIGPSERTGPQNTLKQELTLYVLAADFGSIALPLALMGFLIAVVRLHGAEASHESLSKWNNAITVLATVFPIAFASIMGRLTYAIAQWKLEKGSTVGSLEQLLGSRTFGGTILTQFHLGSPNILGIGLILVWTFSPLGAQSLLRVLKPRLEPNILTALVQYRNTELRNGFSNPMGENRLQADQHSITFTHMGGRLATLLLVPESMQRRTTDLWDNIKIPFLEGSDGNDWRNVPTDSQRDAYSSLSGIPFINFASGNSTFTIESSYLHLQVIERSRLSFNAEQAGSGRGNASASMTQVEMKWPETESTPWFNKSSVGKNGTWSGMGMIRASEPEPWWSIALDRFVDPYWFDMTKQASRTNRNSQYLYYSPSLLMNESWIEAGQTNLLLQIVRTPLSLVGRVYVRDEIRFNVRQKYVESRIAFEKIAGSASSSQSCAVVAQRPSQKHHAQETISQLSFPQVFHHFTQKLPLTTITGTGTHDMLVRYLIDPAQMNPSLNEQKPRVLPDDKTLGLRFSQILNTYMLLSSFGTDVLKDDHRTEIDKLIEPYEISTAEDSNLMQRYSISKLWSAFGLLSSVVFLAGGTLSVVFTHLTDGPEVLGYASTAIRDSKIIDLYPGVGHMAAIDISRMLKDLRVRYGFTSTSYGSPLFGVGQENDTTPITMGGRE